MKRPGGKTIGAVSTIGIVGAVALVVQFTGGLDRLGMATDAELGAEVKALPTKEEVRLLREEISGLREQIDGLSTDLAWLRGAWSAQQGHVEGGP